MSKLSYLYKHADAEKIDVLEYNFQSKRIKGLYCNGTIALNDKLSEAEKTCVLAEELGHYHTSVGNILDVSNINNQKQEKIARKWAVNELVSVRDLIEAVKSGCEYISDVADYLGITDEFLLEAIETFKAKYGLTYNYESYIIHFNDVGFSVENK